MTKEEKKKIKYRMRQLARRFCRRNNVYEKFDGSVGELIEKGYFSAYLLCSHENKQRMTFLEKTNAELRKRIGVYQIGMSEEIEKRDVKLTKAKELLNEFMRIGKASDEDFEHDYSELIGETENFLKDSNK